MLGGIFFTADISFLQIRNPVSPGRFFFHVIVSSRQDHLKWMFTRIQKKKL